MVLYFNSWTILSTGWMINYTTVASIPYYKKGIST
jgi:hypothetical protein